MSDSHDGETYKYALHAVHTFELTETQLKLYYGDKGNYLLFKPWVSTSVVTTDREVPLSAQPAESAETASVATVAASSPNSISTGPNPVSKSEGLIKFYREGDPIVSHGKLKVLSASGKLVRKIRISDDSAPAGRSRRRVGSWDLRDARGRPVAEGTYIVRGAVKTAGGESEKVSLVIGVR
jgi:hypothetical protein